MSETKPAATFVYGGLVVHRAVNVAHHSPLRHYKFLADDCSNSTRPVNASWITFSSVVRAGNAGGLRAVSQRGASDFSCSWRCHSSAIMAVAMLHASLSLMVKQFFKTEAKLAYLFVTFPESARLHHRSSFWTVSFATRCFPIQ